MPNRYTTAACVLMLAALLFVMPAAPVKAFAWSSSDLVGYGTEDFLTVTPSWTVNGDIYTYTYLLNNTTPHRSIETFDLTMPDVVKVGDLDGFSGPAGWVLTVRTDFNQLDWMVDTGVALAPGESTAFQFTTKFGPSYTKDVVAAAHNGLGFSGDTFGPIPEPGSLAALCCGLVSLVGLKLRRE